MPKTRAKHIERSFCHEVSAPPDRVFPLLCPVREFEWVPGWSCDLVHSISGFAELGCVFTRDTPAGRGVWVVCRYEPSSAIAFVITFPSSHVERLRIVLAPHEGGTRLLWTRSYTALTAEGETLVEEMAGPAFELHMARLGKALEHFCRTGTMMGA